LAYSLMKIVAKYDNKYDMQLFVIHHKIERNMHYIFKIVVVVVVVSPATPLLPLLLLLVPQKSISSNGGPDERRSFAHPEHQDFIMPQWDDVWSINSSIDLRTTKGPYGEEKAAGWRADSVPGCSGC